MEENNNKQSVALVTGATSGIGKASATGLARLGFTVVIIALDRADGESAVADIKSITGNTKVDLLVCNLSSQSSVRSTTEEFKQRYSYLNVLVNNAAVFMSKRIAAEGGLELMFATNHLGHFLLTNLLLDRLEAGKPSRVINMTAPSTTAPDFNDLQGERNFNAINAFGASKAENLLFTYALARRLNGHGITVNAYFPGVTRTNLLRNAPLPLRIIFRGFLLPFIRTPERSAKGVVQLAISDELGKITGQLIHDGKIIKAPFQTDTAMQETLWSESVKITGVG